MMNITLVEFEDIKNMRWDVSWLDFLSQLKPDFIVDELFIKYSEKELEKLKDNCDDTMLSVWIDTYLKEYRFRKAKFEDGEDPQEVA